MIKSNLQINKFVKKLILIGLLTTVNLNTFALAADSAPAASVCTIINNQYKSAPLVDYSKCSGMSETKPPVPKNPPKDFDKRSEKEKCEDGLRNKAYETYNTEKNKTPIDGFLYIINEEPLGGTTTDQFSTICARKTECSFAQYSPSQKLRKCVTTYTDLKDCTPTSKSEIESIIKPGEVGGDGKVIANGKGGEPYTYCEDVQVFRSKAGTDLLYRYVGLVYRYMAMLGGVLAVLMMIIAGTLMASAGDNAEQVNKAKAMINKCITGLILLFLSSIILYTINPNFFTI